MCQRQCCISAASGDQKHMPSSLAHVRGLTISSALAVEVVGCEPVWDTCYNGSTGVAPFIEQMPPEILCVNGSCCKIAGLAHRLL